MPYAIPPGCSGPGSAADERLEASRDCVPRPLRRPLRGGGLRLRAKDSNRKTTGPQSARSRRAWLRLGRASQRKE